MIEELEARGRAAAERGVSRAVERIAGELSEALPELEVTAEEGRVAIVGRGLARRLVLDPVLRAATGWVR